MKTLLIITLLLAANASLADRGDSLHIITHNKKLVVTDPSKGYNSFSEWGVFPSASTSYRKVILNITYECPDGLHCGEWDYIDNIILKKSGGKNSSTLDYEIARMISPYGWRFGPDWKFSWHADVTDFATLLHDSVEIEFIHTGYENDKDRGWLITLDFILIEGIPANEITEIRKLWNGTFPYGDTLKSIEDFLTPVILSSSQETDFVRLKVTQTGHGMDDLENCAEFCAKHRDIFVNGELHDRKKIWKECGDNPLYPQAGTWIFDRANWCPGAIVFPDNYDIQFNENDSLQVDINMDEYVNHSKPTANYHFSSFAIFCKEPWAENDVSIEEIISPSASDENSRLNPVCSNPKIIIKNNGRKDVTSVEINYGIYGKDTYTYKWNGKLLPARTEEITLPGIFYSQSATDNFVVTLSEPNEMTDEYPYDNQLTSSILQTPVYDKFILAFHTNKDSTSTFYKVTDADGKTVKEIHPESLSANSIYRDTIDLPTGCYTLTVTDTAGDGLDFWFNPEGGYGYVRLLDIDGRLIKSFTSDFGSGIIHNFIVSEEMLTSFPNEKLPIVNPFPVRNPGKFVVDIFLDEPENVNLIIVSEKGEKVYERMEENFKDGILDIDISSQPDGFYFVKVVTGDGTVEKKIKLKRDG